MKNYRTKILCVAISALLGTFLSASWSYTKVCNGENEEKLPKAKALLVPSYSKLQRDADLIVIATFKDQKIVKEPDAVNNVDEELKIIHSRMSIRLVMKGKCDNDEIAIRHAEPHMIDKSQIANGGLKFQEIRKWTEKNVQIEARPEYLLFLKKSTDEIYEPVTGIIKASLSVRQMFHVN